MNGAGITAILTPPKGPKLRYAARLEFLTTNNIAKYKAVLLGGWHTSPTARQSNKFARQTRSD